MHLNNVCGMFYTSASMHHVISKTNWYFTISIYLHSHQNIFIIILVSNITNITSSHR